MAAGNIYIKQEKAAPFLGAAFLAFYSILKLCKCLKRILLKDQGEMLIKVVKCGIRSSANGTKLAHYIAQLHKLCLTVSVCTDI